MIPVHVSLPLAGWSVICLRPASQQAAVRRLTQARGARHVALPGLRLQAIPARKELEAALACATLVFTSPAAVAFALRQIELVLPSGTTVFAVGAGTARALARQGIGALSPANDAMHSEGMLGLPQWKDISGPVGLVTAPGGRGVIAAGLAQRGIEVRRAEVYRRCAPHLDARHRRALMQATAPRAMLISSAEALDGVLAALPTDSHAQLLDSLAVACSPRLAELARQRGFSRVTTASAPTAMAMLDTLEAWTKDNHSTAFR